MTCMNVIALMPVVPGSPVFAGPLVPVGAPLQSSVGYGDEFPQQVASPRAPPIDTVTAPTAANRTNKTTNTK